MKTRLILFTALFVIGVAGVLFLSLSTPSSARTVAAEFTVERLSCGSCVENIRQAVSQLDGVASVSTDLASRKTRVEYDPDRTDAGTIATTITNSGYPAQLCAQESADGTMSTAVDTDLYIAQIGQRLVARADFNALVEQQRLSAAETGMSLPVQYMVRFAWMTILQRELLTGAAGEAGIAVADAELDAYLKDNQLEPQDREKVRSDLLIERFFQQQKLDSQSNSNALTELLRARQQNTPIRIFDAGLKQSLYGDGGSGGGCSGGCCG